MTSMFESQVRERRNTTPWAKVDPVAFMRDMCMNTSDFKPVTLTAQYRHSVSTRIWWTLQWTGGDGETYTVEAQDIQLCLWRAATKELQIRENVRAKGEEEASE